MGPERFVFFPSLLDDTLHNGSFLVDARTIVLAERRVTVQRNLLDRIRRIWLPFLFCVVDASKSPFECTTDVVNVYRVRMHARKQSHNLDSQREMRRFGEFI